MNFDYSEEDKAIQEQARRVLTENGISVRRQVFEGKQPYDEALWQQVTGLGWTGTAIAEANGGLDLGYVTLCAIAEELGRALAPLPFGSSIFLVAEAIGIAGSAAQKAAHLPALAEGSKVGALAFAEGPGPIDRSGGATSFAGGVLHGEKVAVVDGMVADIAIVAAAGDEPGLVLVDLEQPGVTRTPQAGIDPSRPLARLRFDGAAAERLDGWMGRGSPLDRLLDRAAVLVAFEQLGGAQAALALAKSYAMERMAFGRPIGSFQAIKHKLAEVYVSIELARSLAYYGAWALASDAAELPVAAATARLAATAAFEQASRDLIQTYGGIGMTWEHDAHLYYRRSRHLALHLGDPGEWRERLMTRLAEKQADPGKRS